MIDVADEFGAGSVLTVGLVAVVAAIAAIALPVYAGLSTRQAVAAAADAAALAAADTVSGLAAGYPCENADRVAAAGDAAIVACAIDGATVTVTAARSILGIGVTSSATAGPPS